MSVSDRVSQLELTVERLKVQQSEGEKFAIDAQKRLRRLEYLTNVGTGIVIAVQIILHFVK